MEEEKKKSNKETKKDFQKYLINFGEHLADPKSASVVSQMQTFLNSEFKMDASREDQGAAVCAAVKKLSELYSNVWKIEESQRSFLEDSIEGKLMKQLYRHTFCNTTEEKEEDFVFYRHLLTLNGFIQPVHLGLDEKAISSYTQLYASHQLGKLHHYRTPKDKLIVLTNFITVISFSNEDTSVDSSKGYSNIDKLLPMIIYFLIKSSPILLKSTLRFIKHFRNPECLKGGEGYYHT